MWLMPWSVLGGNKVVVPAGTQDDDPEIKPMHNIYWQSKACGFENAGDLTQYDGLPTK